MTYKMIYLSDEFSNLMTHSDDTIRLTGVSAIKLDSSGSISNYLNPTTQSSTPPDYIGPTDWTINPNIFTYIQDKKTEPVKFESIWNVDERTLKLFVPGSSFPNNLTCQALYFEYSIGGLESSSPGFLLVNLDSNGLLPLVLCEENNLFTLDFTLRYYTSTPGGPDRQIGRDFPEINNIYSDLPNKDNLIREEYGADPGYSAYTLMGRSSEVISEDNKNFITRDSYGRYSIEKTNSSNLSRPINLDNTGKLEIGSYTQRIYTGLKISSTVKKNTLYDRTFLNYGISEDNTKSWSFQIIGLATYDEYLIVNGKPVKKLSNGKTASIWDLPDVKLIMEGTVNCKLYDDSLKVIYYYPPIDRTIPVYTLEITAEIRTRTVGNIFNIDKKLVGYKFGTSTARVVSNKLEFSQSKYA